MAVQVDPTARVWRGSELPTVEQGIKVLGTPIGHKLLRKIQDKRRVLLDAISAQTSSQCGCCSSIALHHVRISTSFAQSHDQGFWQCLCTVMNILVDGCDPVTRATASLPLSLGGTGLRSAQRTRVAACWASWPDSLPMILARHPAVANLLVQHL